jgi:hypothetical protein
MPKIPTKKQGVLVVWCLVGVFVAVLCCVLLCLRRCNDRPACRPQQHPQHHAPKMENFQRLADWGQKTFADVNVSGQCSASGFKTTGKNCCLKGYHPTTLFSACVCVKDSERWSRKNPDYVPPLICAYSLNKYPVKYTI